MRVAVVRGGVALMEDEENREMKLWCI